MAEVCTGNAPRGLPRGALANGIDQIKTARSWAFTLRENEKGTHEAYLVMIILWLLPFWIKNAVDPSDTAIISNKK